MLVPEFRTFHALSAALALLVLPACAAHRAATPGEAPSESSGGPEAVRSLPGTRATSEGDARRAEFVRLRDRMRDQILTRGRTPDPAVSHEPQVQERGGVRVRVQPVSAEAEPWNEWPDGTARLFNDSMGYLWRVEIRSEAPAAWNPLRTQLAVNDTDQTFQAAPNADDVLLPLLEGARLEGFLRVPGDFELRVHEADPFRSRYLALGEQKGDRAGLVLFNAPAEHLFPVAMQLTVALDVQRGGGKPTPEDFVFLFE